MPERLPPASSMDPLHIGDHVTDREGDDATMLVVGLPGECAAEYDIGTDELTVADVNPEYPTADPVVEVIFPSRTDADVEGGKRYAYPRSRLKRVASVHDVDVDEEAEE